jgi:hypothetical protein
MLTIKDLNYFISHVPAVTCCIEAQDVIMAGLKKHWTAETLAICDKLPSEEYYCGPINQMNKIHLTHTDIHRQIYVEDDTSSTGLNRTIDKEFKFEAILPLIKDALTRYQIVTISIELYPDDGKNPGHSFVLIQIDNTTYIVDAYGGYRSCEYRIFDFEAFEQLLRKPTIMVWNELFHSREISEKEYGEIWLEIVS